MRQIIVARSARASALPAPASKLLNLGCGPHSFPGWLNVDVIATETIKSQRAARDTKTARLRDLRLQMDAKAGGPTNLKSSRY
jgi:hypothetical protein